jgi:anti-sigma-K factor RskA
MGCPLGLDDGGELVVGYAAGTLDAHTQVFFERHLKSCVGCAEAVAEQQALWQTLDDWREVVAVSPDFDRRLQSRIAQETRGAGWLARSWRPAVPVVAAGIALGLGLWFNQRGGVQAKAPATAQTAQMENLQHALDDMDLLGRISPN